MIIRYVELMDDKNKKNPKNENIALELIKAISEIEEETNHSFISACFLGEETVPMDGENGLLHYAIAHDKKHKYMLFFR